MGDPVNDPVSTTAVCKELGFTVSVAMIKQLSGVKPAYESDRGAYWNRADIPRIMYGLGLHLIQTAALGLAMPVGDQTPIDAITDNIRIQNALAMNGISTVGEVQRLGLIQLAKIPNLGKKSLQELEKAMADHSKALNRCGIP